MDVFAIEPVPTNEQESDYLLVFVPSWSCRALGLARVISLLAIAADERGRPLATARLIATSRSSLFLFRLSLAILRAERAQPGSFSRRRDGRLQ